MKRNETLAALRERPDIAVLVIGGGINGISVFRELALQRVDVLLAEKGDYCGGASAALSRMVHGGLRYLENGEFKLVKESLLERDRLLRNAPHYVAPLPTTVPIFDIFSGIANGAVRFLGLTRRPSRRGALVIKAGLTLYDVFTASRRLMPVHSFRGARKTLATWPAINPATRSSATYYDAWVSRPERLGLEMLHDAMAASPTAHALNYAQVGSDADGLTLTDTISGETLPVRPRLIINATGGWIDLTNRSIGVSAPTMMGGTKGSHIIVDSQELHDALAGQMIYYENEDGRICILFPYLGKVLIGSTDIRVDDPDQVRCEDDELAYILQSLAFVFPSIRIAEEEIVFRFSGVRPLPASEDSFTGRIPRDHFCEFVEPIGALPATLCMIGGKWTTFRSFGALAADMALERLGLTREIGTEELAIGGGRDFPADTATWCAALASEYKISKARAQTLLERYGSSARTVADEISKTTDTMLPGYGYSHNEIRLIVEREQVETLADIFLRRTTIAITGGLTTELVDAVLDILATHKAWNAKQAAQEHAAFVALLKHQHGVDLSNPSETDNKRSAICA
ncbi:MAG: glycerol-3-phosphate dehydrogenase/oxidase [Aquamicrobium sp.]|uniref:glycerol-3-phosphate dehydrogenase/oxidase n=1 Tax=Mesorhizobium sp. Pch-S TaxID=2082387 RepID=UPI001012CB5A|nr:glycerol-3-phosphate dehydrogenase/oxidase [Mesorhizobium sp. Pch-S]MBR2691255.1 glycerol-3-phosphate dehydrogenase/oxidase [Aquamicrobium sp.]QAZ42219.1 glycerol-3-phosphate dehydrogenase [Mesorhizobium sp. Pch-S]